MSMEEIEKLRLRVEKDSNSRLFLPLAEEYRKTGMLDEAISVILRGLERQPDYMSARVALGRLYLEKNMTEEAREEFEGVVKVIPDNLFSHKKLAEIYRQRGEIGRSVAEYETILRLNPLDDEATVALAEIAGQKKEKGETLESILDKEVFGAGAFEVPEIPEAPEFPEEEALEEAVAEGEELAAGHQGDLDEGNIFEIPEASPVEDIFGETSASIETGEDIFGDLSAPSEAGSGDSPDSTASPVNLGQSPPYSPSEAHFAPSPPPKPAPQKTRSVEEGKGGSSDERTGMSDADSLVSAGHYFKALERYKEILKMDRSNKVAAQRLLELKALMKMMGKGEELVIARLEAFLSAVKRARR